MIELLVFAVIVVLICVLDFSTFFLTREIENLFYAEESEDSSEEQKLAEKMQATENLDVDKLAEDFVEEVHNQ